jgi:regulation of enolase protein 1 (concanavalin A-like superfamily)
VILNAAASDPTSAITRVDFYNGINLLGSSAAPPYTFTWNSMGVGPYVLSAQAIRAAGGALTSASIGTTVIAAGTGLPTPWLDIDIGRPAQLGSSGAVSGTFSSQASGTDIWDVADQFHFTYLPMSGNVTVTARVATLQNTDPWAKAGVMIRGSLTAPSRHGFMAVTAGNGISFQRRLATANGSYSTTGVSTTAPYWVRLVRNGTTVTGYQSANGSSWNAVGAETIPMGTNVYVGLALTSHNNAVLGSATFDGVTITSP